MTLDTKETSTASTSVSFELRVRSGTSLSAHAVLFRATSSGTFAVAPRRDADGKVQKSNGNLHVVNIVYLLKGLVTVEAVKIHLLTK